MLRGIEGKVALVTGGARGLGGATVLRLLEEGAYVVAADVDEDEIKRFTSEQSSDRLLGLPLDVSSESGVQHAVDETVSRFGSLDLVFNNAGIAGPAKPLVEIDVADFDRVYSVNQRGVFLVLKSAIQQMLRQGNGGSIVNTSSAAGLRGFRMRGPYCAVKHAVLGLTKVAAVEYALDGIRVNAVCPGPIETRHIGPVGAAWGGGSEAAGRAEMAKAVPMGRIGEPDEVGALVAWLLSDEASFITGGTYTIDGGRDAL